MNLVENIHRIQSLITEDKETVIKNMIDKHGLYHAIKLMGGYDNIEPYIQEINKTDYIKYTVTNIIDKYFEGRGFNLEQISERPIRYGDDAYEICQIEWLSEKYAKVITYKNNKTYNRFIDYDGLPLEAIDKLFRMLTHKNL